MSSPTTHGIMLLAATCWGAARPAHASPPTVNLDLSEAVQRAVTHNPNLKAALLDAQRAHQDVLAEDGRYWPSLVFQAGATHLSAPGLGAQGGTVLPVNDNFQLASELRQTFPFGMALALRLEGSRTTGQAQFGAGTAQLVELGPGYGLLGKLTLQQPLLRGFGTGVGEATLRQARLSRTAAEQTHDQTASTLLSDVLVAYWELWFAERSLAIDRAAFSLARRQLEEAQKQIAAGALAPVESYAYETRRAEMEQAMIASEALWHQRSLELGNLLGEPVLGLLHASEPSPPAVSPPIEREVEREAKAASAQLLVLRTQLELAQERARIAGDADRPRLDLEAYLQTQGLGNKAVPPALEQLVELGAVSAHIGVTLELPLSDARLDAERASAALATRVAEARLLAAEQGLRSKVAQLILQLERAQERTALATTTATIAERSATAWQERYDHGDAILLEVYTAQDALRRARLTIERGRVDAIVAFLRLADLSGALLRRFASLLP